MKRKAPLKWCKLNLFRKAIGIGRADAVQEKEKGKQTENPKGKAEIPLHTLVRIDGRVVSTRVRIESVDDAALVLLLALHQLRNNRSVTGAEVMDGLRASGYRVIRADQLMSRHAKNAAVIVSGVHRSRRYRLANRGIEKAQEIARRLTVGQPSGARA